MIEATITYKDGTEERREFSTWPAYSKFIDDHAGSIKEADATDLHPTMSHRIANGRKEHEKR